jgi:hypothetical protein
LVVATVYRTIALAGFQSGSDHVRMARYKKTFGAFGKETILTRQGRSTCFSTSGFAIDTSFDLTASRASSSLAPEDLRSVRGASPEAKPAKARSRALRSQAILLYRPTLPKKRGMLQVIYMEILANVPSCTAGQGSERGNC